MRFDENGIPQDVPRSVVVIILGALFFFCACMGHRLIEFIKIEPRKAGLSLMLFGVLCLVPPLLVEYHTFDIPQFIGQLMIMIALAIGALSLILGMWLIKIIAAPADTK